MVRLTPVLPCVFVASDVIKKRLEIKETKDGVTVQDCQIRICNNVNELIKALAEGNKAKATGETMMNRDSSRSHCIFTIFVETASNAPVSDTSQLETISSEVGRFRNMLSNSDL